MTVFVADKPFTGLAEEEQPQRHAASAIPVGTDAAVEQMGLASAFSAYEIQDKSCKGLMQIKPSCHIERMNRLNARNVFNPANNIKIGTDYLAELLKDDDIATALTIYNGQSQKKIEAARHGEYSKYVKNIIEISDALERAHNT